MANICKCLRGSAANDFPYPLSLPLQYHCSHCGVVVCGACGSHQAPLPWQSNPKPHRVCKACFKLMRKRLQDLDILVSSS